MTPLSFDKRNFNVFLYSGTVGPEIRQKLQGKFEFLSFLLAEVYITADVEMQ